MKKDRTVLIAVSLTAVFALLVGVSWYLGRDTPAAAPPAAPKTLPAVWPSSGRAELIRPVPMPTGEMAAALPAFTAGQVLCNAVPEQTWASVLGGPVLREATSSGACHVVTADLDVTATTYREAPERGREPAEITVAGHRGTLTKAPGNAVLTVPLADTRENWATPLLQLEVRQQLSDQSEHDYPGLAQSLGTTMVGAITTHGPALPAPDEQRVSREMTPVPGSGIVDAARPLITWQLCTQLSRALNVPLDQVKPDFFGSCENTRGDTTIKVEYHATSTDPFGDRIAGRPAREPVPGVDLELQLIDDSTQSVEITWIADRTDGDQMHQLAEKLIPPLLGH
jgi:hypothetical protein